MPGLVHGFVKDTLVMFGRVPFAFYVTHFYLLHLLSLALGVLQNFPIVRLLTFPPDFYPPDYGLPLAGIYGVWLVLIVLLYPWYRLLAALKGGSRAWWLSYL